MRGEVIWISEHFKLVIESEDLVSIHIESMSDVAPDQKLATLIRDFGSIAEFLLKDPRGAKIRRLGIASWIVGEHPNAVEKLGFSVDRMGEDKQGLYLLKKYDRKHRIAALARLTDAEDKPPSAAALISREDFLQRYETRRI